MGIRVEGIAQAVAHRVHAEHEQHHHHGRAGEQPREAVDLPSALTEQVKANSGSVKEEIATFTKKAVDLAVEATHTLNEQLKNAAANAPKKD